MRIRILNNVLNEKSILNIQILVNKYVIFHSAVAETQVVKCKMPYFVWNLRLYDSY